MIIVYFENKTKQHGKLREQNYDFFCGLTKLRKAFISFVTSVCPSARLFRTHGRTRLPLSGLS